MSAATTTPQQDEQAARRQRALLAKARKAKAEQAARRKRTAPKRVREIDARMDELARELKSTTGGNKWPIRNELRELANERLSLVWGRG